ncbi:hypothetical protein DOY81_006231 [Sarcophaga bullata]|nr:hypothetical protein DOY81_006231 [Sarcophaga bullata]
MQCNKVVGCFTNRPLKPYKHTHTHSDIAIDAEEHHLNAVDIILLNETATNNCCVNRKYHTMWKGNQK